MVTKREKVEYYDLRISIEPIEEKPFYLTGEDPSFSLIIENPTSRTRRIKIYVRWRLSEVMSHRELEFELNSSATEKYELPREWLYCEGTAIYELLKMEKPPEFYTNVVMTALSAHEDVYPLCSYYVRDKDLHTYEERHRRIVIGLTTVIIILTIINLIAIILFNLIK